MVLSGLGLIGLGAAALIRSLDAAQVLAASSARDAAVSAARLIRRELADPEALLELGGVPFHAVGGELEVPAALRPLQPREDPGRRAVDASLRALAMPGVDDAGLARLEEAARTADVDAACWLWSWLGWNAFREGRPDDAVRWLDCLLDRIPQVVESPRTTRPRAALQSGLLLAAALGEVAGRVQVELLPLVATAPAAELAQIAARLREREAFELVDELEARAAEVASGRAVLGVLGEALPRLRGDSGLLGIGGAVVAWESAVWESSDGERIDGVWLGDAVGALRRADVRLVAEAVDGAEAAVVDAVYVVPGSIDAAAGSAGAWGLGLVLLACGGVFGWSLFTARRALRGEADALRARAEFLQSVTHELKTPLASIRLLAERLHEGRVTREAKQREHHALLAGEAARLTVLVENVLDLGRMERQERGYDRREVEIDEVVGEACRLFAPVAQAAGMELREEYRAAGVVGRIDRGALVQALVNVMENARKYAAAGGVVEVSTAPAEGGGYLLRIRDRGPGIPSDERERIFERFVRGVAQRDGSVSGVGLGLHLARRIAEAHDGTLHCEVPDDGLGAAFVFRLPVEAQA